MQNGITQGVPATAALFHCCDFRIQRSIPELRASAGLVLGSHFSFSDFGGGGNTPMVVEKLSMLSGKLGIRIVRAVLAVHEDCRFPASVEDLLSTHTAIKEQVPDVHLFFLRLDGTVVEYAVEAGALVPLSQVLA